MLNFKKIVGIAAVTVLASSMAEAAVLSIVGGVDYTLGTGADFDPAPSGAIPFPVNSVVKLGGSIHVSSPSDILFTYLGKEASATNAALKPGVATGLDNNMASGTQATYLNSPAGAIPFYFQTNYNDTGAIASNLIGSDTGVAMAVLEWDGRFFAMFDDGGGQDLAGCASNDCDFDDMVVELRAVPIPAAAWLFGSGLIGLAGIARRKKATA